METFLKHSVAAIILAGGKSSRMGTDKALIEFQGVPLLQRTVMLVQTVAKPIYIVTPWIERYQSMVPPDCHLLRENQPSGEPHGPLVGFAQGLAQIKADWVLLLACDLPNLTAAEITRWVNDLPKVSPEAIAYLPPHPKGWEPLCGFYRSSCLNALERFIASGGRSFQQWLNHQCVEALLVNDPNVLFNCNTPADLLKREQE